MLLSGRQDRVVPRRCRDEMAKVRPDALISEIDGPHLLLQARPVEAWRAIMPFIERLPKRPEVIHNVSA
jgi:pimeloyl-ACP methyl ester carboxylesterase